MVVRGCLAKTEILGVVTLESIVIPEDGPTLVSFKTSGKATLYTMNLDTGVITTGRSYTDVQEDLSEAQVQLITALISHRLTGDEVIKSLKTLGANVGGITLTNVFIGGWKCVFRDEHDVETWLSYLIRCVASE